MLGWRGRNPKGAVGLQDRPGQGGRAGGQADHLDHARLEGNPQRWNAGMQFYFIWRYFGLDISITS